jgi:hypothetical protein
MRSTKAKVAIIFVVFVIIAIFIFGGLILGTPVQ